MLNCQNIVSSLLSYRIKAFSVTHFPLIINLRFYQLGHLHYERKGLMIILFLKVCHVHCSTLLIIISDKELPVGQQSQSQSDLSKSITIHNQQSVLDRQSHSILSSAGKILSTDNCIQSSKRDLLSFHKFSKCITGFLLKQNKLSHCAMCVL